MIYNVPFSTRKQLYNSDTELNRILNIIHMLPIVLFVHFLRPSYTYMRHWKLVQVMVYNVMVMVYSMFDAKPSSEPSLTLC